MENKRWYQSNYNEQNRWTWAVNAALRSGASSDVAMKAADAVLAGFIERFEQPEPAEPEPVPGSFKMAKV